MHAVSKFKKAVMCLMEKIDMAAMWGQEEQGWLQSKLKVSCTARDCASEEQR